MTQWVSGWEELGLDGLGGRRRVKYYQNFLSFSFLLNKHLLLYTLVYTRPKNEVDILQDLYIDGW